MQKDAQLTRRTLVKGAATFGASALVVGQLCKPPNALAQDDAAIDTKTEENEQYGFLVKVKNCIDCGECVKACRLWSRTPDSREARREVHAYKSELGKEYFVSTSCMHCSVPSCAGVCPAGAISKGKGGIVVVDQERCIGCKYCYQACPFGVPHYNSKGMDKCDYCLGNDVALGERPRCVRACKVGALHFGKVKNLVADTKGKAQQVISPTGPSYYFI